MLRVSGFIAFLVLLTVVASTHSHAEIVSFSFTGTVIAVLEPNGDVGRSDGDSTVGIVGGTISVGDPVFGAFGYQTNVATDFPGDTFAFYRVPQRYSFSVDFPEVRTQSIGEFLAGTQNDALGNPLRDVFSISDGLDPLTNDGGFTGSQILANGEALNAYTAFDLFDDTASAFDVAELPTSLNLSDFNEARIGFVAGDNTDDSRFVAFYQVDSLQVVSVPEPSTIGVLCLAILPLLVSSRRSRQAVC